MTRKDFDDLLLSYPNVWLDFPFGDTTSVYKIGHKETGGGKMFALIDDNAKPLRISLKCDPQLAILLREKYESVQPGYHLNKKHWNTVLYSGQIDDEEIKDLIRLSYNLVSGVVTT